MERTARFPVQWIIRHPSNDYNYGKSRTDDALSSLQWAQHVVQPDRKTLLSRFSEFSISTYQSYTASLQIKLSDFSRQFISQSGDVSVLGWVGEVSSFHSCFPTNLMSYQTTPCVQSASRDLSRRSRKAMDLKRAGKLWSDLAELPFPQFINHTLKIPSIVHQVTVMKPGATPTPQTHTYEIQAPGPGATLSRSVRLGGSGTKLPYILVHPWHPKSLDKLASDKDVPLNLIDQLVQPFNALLLKKFRDRQYKRTVADCMIYCCTQDLPSITNYEILTLDIV